MTVRFTEYKELPSFTVSSERSPIGSMIIPPRLSPASEVITEMLSLAEQKRRLGEELIPLGAGGPATSEVLAPYRTRLGEIAREVLDNIDGWANYAHPQGIPELRSQIAERTNEVLGIPGYYSEDEVVITNGGQQALDMLRAALSLPGDVIFTAAPTYLGALANFGTNGAIVAGIPIDDDGMEPDKLREQVEKARRNNLRSRFVYLNPTLANPTGEIMSLARRQAILQAVTDSGIVLIEDDPYRGLVNSAISVPSPVASLESNLPAEQTRVIYVGSFSKVIAPGLRIGYICSKNPHLIERLNQIKANSDLSSSPLAQALLLRILQEKGSSGTENLVDEIRKNHVRVNFERQILMEEALLRNGAGQYFFWQKPLGSLFFWITAQDSRMSMSQERNNLHEVDVEIIPGAVCYPSPNLFNPSPLDVSARLNFTGLKREMFDEATKRFVRCVEENYPPRFTSASDII